MMELPVLLPNELTLVESPLLLPRPTFAARLQCKTKQNTKNVISIARIDFRNRDILFFMIARISENLLVLFSALIKGFSSVFKVKALHALKVGDFECFSHFFHDLPVGVMCLGCRFEI